MAAIQRIADESGDALLLRARILPPDRPFAPEGEVTASVDLMAVCLMKSADGRIDAVTPQGVQLLGAANMADVVGRPLSAFLPKETIASILSLAEGTSAAGYSVTTKVFRLDGQDRDVAMSVMPFGDGPHHFLIEMRSRYENRLMDEKLRLAETVFAATVEAIVILDSDFRIVAVNPAFSAITGFSAEEVVGTLPVFFDLATDPDMLTSVLATIGRTGRWDQEQWSRRKSGEEFAKRLSIVGVADGDGDIRQYVALFADVTQRKHDEERIRYQANYDSLTGLPNRSLFMDRLCQALHLAERAGQRVGLMYIDLDGFKLINDTLGHEVGDELLKEAAKRLLFCVRHGDTVARLGGDEFTIIMPNLGEIRYAPVIAQRMIEALEQPFHLENREAFISASIGITMFPDDAVDANTLLKNADAAMYRAKEQGKANYQFFTADINAEVSERMIIKNGLSKALEREEFTVYYQPKCDLATGRLTGVEALLRWRNMELGAVSPVKFIPVMEETGLIGTVGEWVLEMACQQYRIWRDAGHPHMRVAVNLSVRQLRQPNLARSVEEALRRAGIEASGIELEITESMIMRDTENAIDVLRTLSEMGIHLAMDDFGTGYSSLSYLKKFPVHTIKIDRSFINDIATDPDDQEIIRTIISMGHSLRRKVVAEGVETEEQRILLRKLRCDEMQGYLLSPPVPAAEIDRLLASLRPGPEA
nr:EAL domain-containing protein [Telmatospirillum siberiense]